MSEAHKNERRMKMSEKFYPVTGCSIFLPEKEVRIESTLFPRKDTADGYRWAQKMSVDRSIIDFFNIVNAEIRKLEAIGGIRAERRASGIKSFKIALVAAVTGMKVE